MKYLNKIAILSLGVVCHISNVDINAGLYPYNNANNYITVENTNNISIEIANNLTNNAKQVNQIFNFYNGINTVIKSFIENNKNIEENSIKTKIVENCLKESLNFTDALSNLYHINIEVSLQNPKTPASVYEELYNNHFRNAIINNNINKIGQILIISCVRVHFKNYEIQTNKNIIKTMSQDEKQLLRDYLITNHKERIDYIYNNFYVNYLNSTKEHIFNLAIHNAINSNVATCGCAMINQVLKYLNSMKECLKELDIDPATLG